jgi:hypothetical protein
VRTYIAVVPTPTAGHRGGGGRASCSRIGYDAEDFPLLAVTDATAP